MFGFSRKRFLITLGVSVVVWYGSVLVQGITGYKAPFNALFSGSICKVTGFPISLCLYGRWVWLVNIINITFWFLILHFLWKWFENRRVSSRK